jgi:hypothetical protein
MGAEKRRGIRMKRFTSVIVAGATVSAVAAGSGPAFAADPAIDAPVDPSSDELADVALANPEISDEIVTLQSYGLDDSQVLTVLRYPSSVSEWSVQTETSSNVVMIADANATSIQLQDGRFAAPAAATGDQECGWASTVHIGSTFAVESARLTMRTDFCWKNDNISGTPQTTHRSSLTEYGNAGGWRVNSSYLGADGAVTGTQWLAESKADWRLLACAIPFVGGCVQVDSGTAYVQHRVYGSGGVSKQTGGWPR